VLRQLRRTNFISYAQVALAEATIDNLPKQLHIIGCNIIHFPDPSFAISKPYRMTGYSTWGSASFFIRYMLRIEALNEKSPPRTRRTALC
jgi:hypothetical protein